MFPGTRIHSRLAALALAAFGASAAAQDPVEVLHWWTSGSEAAAVQSVKRTLLQRGYEWEDSSVAGGDDRKRLVAAARAGAGRLPDALQLHAFSLREQADEFRNLDELARRERWDAVVPAAVSRVAKIQGHWRATPVDLHRTNWVFANKQVFDRLGLAPPRTFGELLQVAKKLRKAGVMPLAHGREPWQDALLFDNAVLSAGGPTLYRRALLELQPDALGGAQMVAVFRQLQSLRELVDDDATGRPWNFATQMVARGKAGMQVMGDWAKGELLKQGHQAGRDFICFPYPGTEGAFVFVADMFAMPSLGPQRATAQEALASTLIDPQVQADFNRVKGSLPVRSDVSLDGYDDCAQRASSDLALASRRGSLLPRFASVLPERVREAMTDVVSRFMAGTARPEDGAAALLRAVQKASAASE
jgi:glucose/mannose transport system substrate-binding protein